MGEQSRSLEHAAVGGPGTDKPESANSLNLIQKGFVLRNHILSSNAPRFGQGVKELCGAF